MNASRIRSAIACFCGWHSWHGCQCSRCPQTRDQEHDWDGCRCARCGRKRDKAHQWDGCRCARCGRERDEAHQWDGCRCLRCGRHRHDVHKWDGCKCTHCWRTRDEAHRWDGCRCTRCWKTRDEGHQWGPVSLACDECGGRGFFPIDVSASNEWPGTHWQHETCSRCSGSGRGYRPWRECVKCRKREYGWDLSHDQIAQRAKQIRMQRGCPRGKDKEIWFEAEKQLTQELEESMRNRE
jgi:hypothetical protein